MNLIVAISLWFSIAAAGIMAGVYFAFSAFIMRALAALEGHVGAEAMRSVNRVILRSSFLPLFMASTLAALVLVAIGLLRYGQPGALEMALGGAVYAIGMFGVTMIGNVPLNNRLEACDPAGLEGRSVWQDYLRRWTFFNHIRTAACLAALILFVRAALVAAALD